MLKSDEAPAMDMLPQTKSKRDAEARRQREHDKWKAEQADMAARRKAEADELSAVLAPLLDAEAFKRVYDLIHRVYTTEMRGSLMEAWGRTEIGREHNAKQGAVLDRLLHE